MREGELVREGQVLVRMDTALLAADGRALAAEYQSKRLALRRIDAQLAGTPLRREADDPPALVRAGRGAVRRQRRRLPERARRRSAATLERARHDLAAANEVRAKLLAGAAALPRAGEGLREALEGRLRRAPDVHRQAARAHREGAGPEEPGVRHRRRQRDDRAVGEAHRADQRRLPAPAPDRARRGRAAGRAPAQELAKQQHRHGLLELRAPQAGT